MNSCERVLLALRGEQPDRVPFCELEIDPALAYGIMGWGHLESQEFNLEANVYTVDQAKEIASFLHMDNIFYVLRAPVYAHKLPGEDGRLFYGEGMIQTEADLSLLQFPDPLDDALYAEAEEFVKEKDQYSLWLITRIGIFPTMLSMGIENFSLNLYDNLAFVETVLDLYCDWATIVAERVSQLGFDVFVSTDDFAFKTTSFYSPSLFRNLVLPRYRRVAEKLTIPWIIHSDGNVTPFLEDLMTLGISGLHPIEKGAMDIRAMKQEYGDQLCLLGNVDLDILGRGTTEEVDREVQQLISDVGPGGGYILTSGNSLAGYLRPENVLAMAEAVRKYGRYPLDV